MSDFIRDLAIPDVKVLRPLKHGDHRGFFSEVYNKETLAKVGITLDFVQDNHSFSQAPWTLRGLHFQVGSFAQAKMIRVIHGSAYDVAVDLREGSPTKGQWVSVVLSARDWNQILIPSGFAHGILTLEPDTEILYKVTTHYSPAHDQGLAWDDPDLAIDWPLRGNTPILSDKDTKHPRYTDLSATFGPDGAGLSE
ncbi:MAG: dTDP-4-dehydrorhamnose 3,5-epimerase [Rhodospirillum sp.]|nr:dTDP-4-dehydrorhamnose 3,5-epimerase [Rhodospirillum sp.]MCF8490440.1 dTDP-4-dehydrorhamnose 3,5-epimerase [Rhodospirillum sp.]MCF8500453.1 dTDP-4-dehydrorhamnose 3,5-epimerase [Rhodospirillum sp.]